MTYKGWYAIKTNQPTNIHKEAIKKEWEKFKQNTSQRFAVQVRMIQKKGWFSDIEKLEILVHYSADCLFFMLLLTITRFSRLAEIR